MNELEILDEAIRPYLNGKLTLRIWKQIYDSISKHELNPEREEPILKKIPNDEYISGSRYFGGYIEFNENFKEVILENINCLEIENFYPTVMKRLIESDILEVKNLPNFGNVFLTIYNNFHIFKWGAATQVFKWGAATSDNIVSSGPDDLKKYNLYKLWLNYTYGILYSDKNEYTPNIILTTYVVNISQKIANDLNWIYVDTDRMFFYGDYDLEKYKKYGVKCRVQPIEWFWIKNKKKYIIYDQMGIDTKGLVRRGQTPQDVEDIISEIRSCNRQKIIDTI